MLKLTTEEWSEATVKVYVGSKGINTHGSNKIIQHVNYIMAYNYHIANDTNDSTISEVIKQDYIDNTEKYKTWTGGPFWHSNLSLHFFWMWLCIYCSLVL